MRDGHWWIKPGLLTSGEDPTGEMVTASGQFADDYVPMVFMTGDAHRTPPFQWTTRGAWNHFFDDVIQANKICCHVELYADQVTVNAVPANLSAVFHNGKVFGWEPEVYKIIQGILESIIEILPQVHLGVAQSKATIRSLTSEMWRVHGHGYLQPEGVNAMNFWDLARTSPVDPVPVASLPGFLAFLSGHNNTAMGLRTGIHNVVGATIQKKINQYPDHMHLITCGDAHILHNPLYRFIEPPVGTFGIADENSH
jgi:hypothetical protein